MPYPTIQVRIRENLLIGKIKGLEFGNAVMAGASEQVQWMRWKLEENTDCYNTNCLQNY